MGSRIDNAQRHGVMTSCHYDVIQGSSSNGSNRWGVVLASFPPGCRAFLQVGIYDNDLLAAFLSGHGCMDSQCGLTAAAFLAEESESLHAKSLAHGIAL